MAIINEFLSGPVRRDIPSDVIPSVVAPWSHTANRAMCLTSANVGLDLKLAFSDTGEMNAIDPDDAALLTMARRRDADNKLTPEANRALGQLYDRHNKRLIAYMCTQFPGRGEDLAMAVWLKILEPSAKFEGGNFRAWLFRIGYNSGISELRKQRLSSMPEGADAVARERSTIELWVLDEEEQTVNRCLERLLPLEREVVLRWKMREKHQEIAVALGITRSKSEQLQHAAMKKLRDCAEGQS